VRESQRDRGFAGPIFPGEQNVLAALEPAAATLLHQRDKDRMDLVLKRLDARNVVGIFRLEWIEHRLVLAGGIEPALDANLLDQFLKAEGAANDADRSQDR